MLLRRNICLYTFILVQFISKTLCQNKSSLTFVIDTTGSMSDDITQVKNGITDIMNVVLHHKSSQVQNVVLVTFNDPDVKLVQKSRNVEEFLHALDSIVVEGGDDCPESSLSGIELGLRESRPASYIYVFTDADSKDYNLVDNVKDLCQQTQSHVIFILSGYCESMSRINYRVYHDIAAASAGQVFHIKKSEVKEALPLVEENASGHRTVLTYKIVPKNVLTDIPFTVDDIIQYVIISAAGYDVFIELVHPLGNYEPIVWTSSVKVVKIGNPGYGNYTVKVMGGTETSVTVHGRTDFTFEYGFSKLTPSTMSVTSKQTYQDVESYLTINVNDPEHAVQIKYAEILNMDEQVFEELPLQKAAENFYTTPPFVPPGTMFKVAVKGTAIKNGASIRRVASIPVTPVKSTIMAPEIKKVPSVVEAKINTSVDLNCTILKESPQPTIKWQFKGKHSQKFSDISNIGQLLRISVVKLENAGSYKCVAENKINRDEYNVELVIEELIAQTLPMADIAEGTTTNIKYNDKLQLTCRVRAYPKPTIVWKNSEGNILPSKSSQIKIPYEYISDLQITNVKTSDTFYCDAYNNVGTATANIVVNVGEPFVINKQLEALKIIEYGKEGILQCEITSHLPMDINWYYLGATNKRHAIANSDKYVESPNKTQLGIKNMGLDLAGKYTCEASLISDPKIRSSYDTKVVVYGLVAPQIKKVPSVVKAKINSSVDLNCMILKGNPKPTIKWQFKGKHSQKFSDIYVTEELLHIVIVELENAGSYKCEVENVIDRDEYDVELIVEVPPEISLEKYINVQGVYGDLVLKLPCEVTGLPKPDVVWRKNGAKIIPSSKYTVIGDGLVINNPMKTDNGKYTCEAKNSAGANMKQFDIFIASHPAPTGKNQKYFVKKGKKKQISCSIPNSNSDSVKWYKDGKFYAEGPYLDYKETIETEFEEYVCRVSNNKEAITGDTIRINVGFSPQFKNSGNHVIDWRGENENIDCLVNSKPISKVQWTYNGAIIQGATNFKLKVNKWGNYICSISNIHGNISRTTKVTSSVCLIDMRNKNISNVPLIINEESTWPDVSFKNNYLIIEKQEALKLDCHNLSNKSNSFRSFTNRSEIQATCDREDKFLIDGKSYEFSKLRCKNDVKPVIKNTGTECLGHTTENIKIGFQANDFIDLYDVCFEKNKNIPLYTKMKMSHIHKITDEPIVNWESYGNVTKNKTNGSTKANCYKNSKCCYAKTQLVNVRDVFYGPAQVATYIDPLNSVYNWIPCNDTTSWNDIEEYVRSIFLSPTSSVRISELFVWTGASNYSEINGLSVPRYLWKVVKQPESHTDVDTTMDAVALIYKNDPSLASSDRLCKDICDELKWVRYHNGMMYCCRLNDFAKSFNIPIATFYNSEDE